MRFKTFLKQHNKRVKESKRVYPRCSICRKVLTLKEGCEHMELLLASEIDFATVYSPYIPLQVMPLKVSV